MTNTKKYTIYLTHRDTSKHKISISNKKRSGAAHW